MSQFGSSQERVAKLLFTARMEDCWGKWKSVHRFEWPETREEWEHYQHNPHSQIEIAMAQAKAIMPFLERVPE